MKYLLYFIPLLLLFSTCKQPDSGPKTTYTIKGRVMNGTTGATYANQAISASVHTRDPGSIGGKGADLGTGKTDAQGNFSLSYTQTDINYDFASITISSNFLILKNIPVNKNIDSIFFISTLGNVKIYLKTNTPLESNKDTFFLVYNDYKGNTVWDTIKYTVNGFYKEVRVQTPSVNLVYGRDYVQIHSDPKNPNNITVAKVIYENVTGDPCVDSVTINY